MEQKNRYSIVLADDFQLVRLGIKAYLMSQPKFEVVGEASNGVEALEMIQDKAPDIAIVDIVMPYLDGISIAKYLKENGSKTKVLLMTAVEEFVDLRSAFFSGVDGIVLKNISQQTFLDTLNGLINERKVYCKAVFQLLFDQTKFVAKDYGIMKFTKLQQKIINRRLRGYLFSEIAEELNLSVPQVAQELSGILELFDDSDYSINFLTA